LLVFIVVKKAAKKASEWRQRNAPPALPMHRYVSTQQGRIRESGRRFFPQTPKHSALRGVERRSNPCGGSAETPFPWARAGQSSVGAGLKPAPTWRKRETSGQDARAPGISPRCVDTYAANAHPDRRQPCRALPCLPCPTPPDSANQPWRRVKPPGYFMRLIFWERITNLCLWRKLRQIDALWIAANFFRLIPVRPPFVRRPRAAPPTPR
jgi:hypothetical protein